jgi:hypothetical protein
MAGTDDYLTEWRKGDSYSLEGDPEMLVQHEAARLETEYTQERIKNMVDNHGRT